MAEGIYQFSVINTLGYYWDHFGRLLIEPTEAKIVEYIYESCLEGATPAEIAAALTEQGIKSPKGKDFGGLLLFAVFSGTRNIAGTHSCRKLVRLISGA